MKRIKHYFIIVAFASLLTMCGDPTPTEIIPDTESSDSYDIEVLSKNPDDYVYQNGYDSTGTTDQRFNKYKSVIYASLTKNTLSGITNYTLNAEAVFYDKREPVFFRDRQLGFRSRYIGTVFFNQDTAEVIPNRRRFLDNGMIRDTLLGYKYGIRKRSHLWFPDPVFTFQGIVRIGIKPVLEPRKDFRINMPDEITAQIDIPRYDNGVPVVRIRWDNKNKDNKIDIILAGYLKGNGEKFPIYRLRTKDDGLFIIPPEYTAQIPLQNFNLMLFTLIRNYTLEQTDDTLNETIISANTIHNIAVPLEALKIQNY